MFNELNLKAFFKLHDSTRFVHKNSAKLSKASWFLSRLCAIFFNFSLLIININFHRSEPFENYVRRMEILNDNKLFLWNKPHMKDVNSNPAYCWRSSPSQTSNMLQAGFESAHEPEFRLCWMKLCSSDNHYSMAQQILVSPWKTLADKN